MVNKTFWCETANREDTVTHSCTWYYASYECGYLCN